MRSGSGRTWILGSATLALMVWIGGALACAGARPEAPEGPAAAEAAVRRADMALAMGQAEAAAAGYREALELDPASGAALLGLARSLAQLGDATQALALYDALATGHPSRFEALGPRELCAVLGAAIEARMAEASAIEALAVAGRVSELGCEGRISAGSLARVHRAAAEALAPGHASDAIDHYREAIRLEPQPAEVFIAAARLLIAEGRRPEALDLLIRGLGERSESTALKEFAVEILAGS